MGKTRAFSSYSLPLAIVNSLLSLELPELSESFLKIIACFPASFFSFLHFPCAAMV